MLTCFGTSPEGPSNLQTNVGRPDAHDPAPPGHAHGAAAKQRERADGETGGQRMDDRGLQYMDGNPAPPEPSTHSKWNVAVKQSRTKSMDAVLKSRGGVATEDRNTSRVNGLIERSNWSIALLREQAHSLVGARQS
jgi:hypothetical protein